VCALRKNRPPAIIDYSMKLIQIIKYKIWQVVVAFVCFALSLPLFAFIMRWIAAKSPSDADLEYMKKMDINPDWPAFIIEHGRALEWDMGVVQDNWLLFGMSILGFLLLALPLIFIFVSNCLKLRLK